MNNPLVTIIIPSYNHARYVGYTIDSILKQTLQDFELLIIDDNSTDNSLEIIRKFHDPRIKITVLDKNIGMCRASNLCIAEAKGKFLTIIASDDIMKVDNLEKKVNFLQNNPQYGAVFSQIEIIDENNKTINKKTKKFEKIFPAITQNCNQLLNHFFNKGNYLAAPTFLAKTEFVKKINGFNDLLCQAHDFDMWVRICLNNYEIEVLSEKLVQYRQFTTSQSLSSNTSEVRKRLIFDNEKILENYLSIKDSQRLIEIFPELSTIQNKITEDLIPFFVALQALKIKNSAYHYQFAINTLYNLLKDKKIQEKLEKEFNFSNQDFFKIVTKNPLGTLIETCCKKPFYKKAIRKIGNILKVIK